MIYYTNLEIFQAPSIQLFENSEPVWVHRELGELVHDFVEQDLLLVAVALHCQRDAALGVGQAVANTSQLRRVGVSTDIPNI